LMTTIDSHKSWLTLGVAPRQVGEPGRPDGTAYRLNKPLVPFFSGELGGCADSDRQRSGARLNNTRRCTTLRTIMLAIANLDLARGQQRTALPTGSTGPESRTAPRAARPRFMAHAIETSGSLPPYVLKLQWPGDRVA
jgi:hypothetical protein